MADHSFADAASGAEVSTADAEDHCCADSAEDEDTSLESVRLWIAAQIAAQIAVRIAAHREEEDRWIAARQTSESPETRADSATNQVTGRATALIG